MDSILPGGLMAETASRLGGSLARALDARKGAGRAALPFDTRLPMTAVSGGVRYGVLRLGAEEIVVEHEGRAPMRGTVDLFAGGERVGRLLVQLAWQDEGRSGYELKRRSFRALTAATPHGAREVAVADPLAVRAAEAP